MIEEIVDAIIDDLTDRKALRHVWDNIDEDIQSEIRETWIAIVRQGVHGATTEVE